MKLKTSDLTGPALDWAVDEARGFGADYLKWWRVGGDKRFTHCEIMRAYSTDWSQGGPIIERERIEIRKGNPLYFPKGNEKGDFYEPLWLAGKMHGPTPLIAAMRGFVASKLGDTIDIPEELL